MALKVSYKLYAQLNNGAALLSAIHKDSQINSQFIMKLYEVFQLGTQQAYTMEPLPMTLTIAVK
jgi:hypothetical protein